MNLTVTLGHARNPDIAGGYWAPPTDPGRKHDVEIDSIDAAPSICRDFIERNGLGGGNWIGGHIKRGGRVVARVMFNGRMKVVAP